MQSPTRPRAAPSFAALAAFAAFATLLALAGSAHASLVEALDLRELVRRASYVVTATAVSQRALYDSRGRIVTDVTLEVGESMRGPAQPGDRLVVRCLGGRIGEIGMRIEGEARFTDGEESLLFLAAGRPSSGGGLRPVGMSQGVMRIARGGAEPLVLPGGGGLSLVQRVAGGQILRAPAAIAHPEPLREVLRRVEALASELPEPSAPVGASHE